MENEEIEETMTANEAVNPDTRLPDEQNERKIIKDIVELAEKSHDYFNVENERKKDDARVYAEVEIFNKQDLKAMTTSRATATVNPLPLYINAMKNLFLTNPFIAQVEGQNGDSFREFLDTQLKQIFTNSDADNSVFSESLDDIGVEGVTYMYLTTEDGKITINLAYEPSGCIYDPCTRKMDGSDAEFFGIVEQLPYDRVKQMAEDNGVEIPSKERIKKTPTWMFAGFNSSIGSVNLIHFFKKEKDGVYFMQVVGDKVIKRVRFRNLSSIPVVPVYGQRFKDGEKKFYKGFVRDTKHLCKIVNGCYVSLWERVSVPSVPYTQVSMESIENVSNDYDDDMVRYKRYKAYTIKNDQLVSLPSPQRIDPVVVTADLLPVIQDSLKQISRMIGIPEEGLGFSVASTQTATEVLTRSSALVTNVSHYYRHLQRSIQRVSEIIVEMLCIYNNVPNTYSVKLMKGPEDALKREQRRQQILAFQTLAPDAVKPILLAEAIKTGDFENAEQISAAIYMTLPPELKATFGMGGADVATMQQQVAALTQQVAELQQQNDEYRRTIDTDMVAAQNQILMSRMNNEAALRSKLVDIEASAIENEKNRQLELAKMGAAERAQAEKFYLDSRAADERAKEAAVNALENAQKLRLESERIRAEIIAKFAKAAPVAVVAQ